MQKTLVLLKPDAVKRNLIGTILQRFERAGLKIVGMKLVWPEKETAKKHYGDDIIKRRGEKVRNYLLDFITSGPVIALILEGSSAVENVRKICGDTEPKNALPGTIRGDFCHHSYGLCDSKSKAIANIIHASASKTEAEQEIQLWFKKEEIYDYKTVNEDFVF